MTLRTHKDEPLVLATVIQVQPPTSARQGDKALISADSIVDGWVGGGCVQPAVVSAARSVLTSKESCLLRIAPNGTYEAINGVEDYSSHCLGKGSVLLYVEPINTQTTLSILGQSEVAEQLAILAAQMDFNVTLCGNNVFFSPFPIQLNQSNEFKVDGADFVVIATQGQGDKAAINAALTSNCEHIEIVISEKKLRGLKHQLQQSGYTDDQLARLEGPAGIDINAKKPNEIALSILASLIKKRRSDKPVPATKKKVPFDNAATSVQNNTGGCCGGD